MPSRRPNSPSNSGYANGLVDRPIEIVVREVDGMPKGTVKAVIDAYEELVDEGCLAVIGPSIVDNAVPTKLEIEKRFHVPSVSMCASEDFLRRVDVLATNGLARRKNQCSGPN